MPLPDFLTLLRRSPPLQRSFFEDSHRAMFRALSRRNGHLPAQMLEDAIAQTYAQLWQGEISGFNSRHAPHEAAFRYELSGYLANVVAPRKLIDLLRRQLREPNWRDLADGAEAGDEADDDTLLARLLPPALEDPVVAETERREVLARLQRCINHLTPRLQEAINGFLNDLKQAETAAVLGIPEGTVKSRMNEAVKKLKRCMGIATEGVQA